MNEENITFFEINLFERQDILKELLMIDDSVPFIEKLQLLSPKTFVKNQTVNVDISGL